MKVLVDLALLKRIYRVLRSVHPIPEAELRDLRELLSSGGGWTKANGYDGPSEDGARP